MELSPSLDADICWARHEIPCLLLKAKVHYLV